MKQCFPALNLDAHAYAQNFDDEYVDADVLLDAHYYEHEHVVLFFFIKNSQKNPTTQTN